MTDELIGKVVADKYRIESLIREGANGDLFVARHEIRDTPVTICVLPEALSIDARWSKRFVDDARRASSVADPNILNITDFGTDAHDVTYAVYEPINGKTLREVLSEAATLEQHRAISLTRQIASAVAAAHTRDLVHGGLTPENIFIRDGEDGVPETVKVFGFGADPSSVERGADPHYLAPEQLATAPTADERTDVYALGVILYEMLSGVVPFPGAKAVEVSDNIAAAPPQPLSAFRSDLHTEIEPIVLTALAADPERRYQTITAFADDLALAAGTPKETAAVVGRNLWQTAFIVLAGVFLLGIALIYATTVRRTDPTVTAEAEPGALPVQPIGPATGAQEESLAKMPELTEADILAMQAGTMEIPPGTLPGGDGYNAWANSGAPPLGAPPPTGAPPGAYVPPGGQVVTVDPSGTGSQFMPPEGGVILVPVPVGNSNTAAKPTPTPKSPAGNTAAPSATPKPMATPLPKNTKPGNTPTGKPANRTGKPGEYPE